MIERILSIIDNKFKLTERKCDEFSSLKLQGMNFENSCFSAEGLGNVAVMNITSDNGFMSMQTLIVNPFAKDAPMLSYDCINMQGIAILYLEPFNTTLSGTFDASALQSIVEEYGVLENNPQGEHWYDSMRLNGTTFKKTANKEKLDEMIVKYYEAYVNLLETAPACDEEAKKLKAKTYSDGLIENGGPATDPFMKAFGKEATEKFFKEVLFGV